jgi:DUF917 family protein
LRQLALEEIDWIAEGAQVLGAGGGGNAYQGTLALRRQMRQGARVMVADAAEVADDAIGPVVGGMGAPTVGLERIAAAGRWRELLEGVRAAAGRIDFLAIGEIGGGNAISPLVAGAESGLPVVDADPMGRAFPELQMDTYSVGGIVPSPLVLSDGKGVVASMTGVADPFTAERYARALTWAMGGSAGLAMGLVRGADVRRLGIAGTLSLAEELGRAMEAARRRKRPTADAICEVVPTGRRVFEGKIVDVVRRTVAGFARGLIRVSGIGASAGERLEVEFQNEYLIARQADGEVLLTVPDLVVLVEQETGRALGSETVRYGLRIDVLGLPAAREIKTPECLAVMGPRAFGYDVDFRPLPGDLLGRPEPVLPS